MKLRRFAALAGAMVMTLGVAGAVFADSGSPTSINSKIDGLKVTVDGNWTWDAASCNDSSKKIVGWAVSWGEPGYTDNAVPKSGGGSYYMGDAVQGNTVFTKGDLCSTPSGTWGPLSHTYAAAGSYDVCVIIYDLRDPAPATKAHSLLAGGGDADPKKNEVRNTDNSVEENFLEGQSVCLSAETVVVVPTPVPTPTNVVAGASDVAPQTDAIVSTTTSDAGGALPLLLIILGVIGLGAAVLTPGRAKR